MKVSEEQGIYPDDAAEKVEAMARALEVLCCATCDHAIGGSSGLMCTTCRAARTALAVWRGRKL